MKQKTIRTTKCFVCGSENPRGLNIPFTFHGDKVTAEFVPSDDYCGFDSVVHGGILFALADEAMMHLIYANNIRAITSEVTIRMKTFARTNEKIHIEGFGLNAGKHLVTCQAKLANSAGKSICMASGKFLYYTENNSLKKTGL